LNEHGKILASFGKTEIPWHLYSEAEMQEIVSAFFEFGGFCVYRAHLADRRGEKGADLVASRSETGDSIAVAVKKKPVKKDILQLQELSKRKEKKKVYIYTLDPSADFKNAAIKCEGKVEFWNRNRITDFAFEMNPALAADLAICNSPMANEICALQRLMLEMNEDARQSAVNNLTVSNEVLIDLFFAKDRATSLNKGLMTLHTLLEEVVVFPRPSTEQSKEITRKYLDTLLFIVWRSVAPLLKIFRKLYANERKLLDWWFISNRLSSFWVLLLAFKPRIGHTMKKESEKPVEVSDSLSNDVSKSPTRTVWVTIDTNSNVLSQLGEAVEGMVDDLFGRAWEILFKRPDGSFEEAEAIEKEDEF